MIEFSKLNDNYIYLYNKIGDIKRNKSLKP